MRASLATASAPGSLMILGEHAVLHGFQSVCAAIDRRIQVTLRPRADALIHVVSSLGERTCPLAAPDTSPPFAFVMKTVEAFQAQLGHGLDIEIESEFREDLGLGSSAAVTVATHAGLDRLLGNAVDPRELQLRCRAVVRAVQGCGSGADTAASILGGVVAYSAEPLSLERIADTLPLVTAYSGSKEKTAVVIALVEQLRVAHPEAVAAIYRAMDAIAREGVAAIRAGDWPGLGRVLDMGQGLMAAIGVSNVRLAAMVQLLRATAGIHGAKISGSGLGDCVIGVGQAASADLPFDLLPIQVSGRGLEYGATC